MTEIRTTCAYCGVGCGISARVTGVRDVIVRGDREHPANAGRLCSKGTHLGETVGLKGRLLHPMIGGDRVSWDQALDLAAARMRGTIARYGPDSVAFYVSGQLLTEDYYVANKLMKGFIGSGNIDTNSRLCMASAVAAHTLAFGEDVVPCTYDDLDKADLILLVGSNTAWCHPVVWQRIEAARATRGTKLVVIDPRRTETAEQADLHIAVAPDGDIALFNALLAAMRDRNLLDRKFLVQKCKVPANFIERLNANDCGISPSDFAMLADLVAAHPRMVTLFSQGVNQSRCGTDKGNAIINLHLALGRINREGTGPFSITGQPNAMGGREVGGLANMLACHLGFSTSERGDVARFWQAPNLCTKAGLKAVDLFRAVHDRRIKFLWVMGTNPAASMPDSTQVRDALASCETVVVSENCLDTDTTRFAHIRLPALAWGEKDGTVTNSERRISRQRILFAPPGEARADWAILSDFAARMGWADAFSYTHPHQIFREYAAMTALARRHGKVLGLAPLARLSEADYDALDPVLWGGAYPFATRFSHPDGKARVVAVENPVAVKLPPDFPLRLNTGRYRDQWHMMTRTGLSPMLSQHRREPLLDIHPADAQRHALADGGLAKVTTAAGSAIFKVAFASGQRSGDIFVPLHWTDTMGGESRANCLPLSEMDRVSGQPGFKNTPARVEPVQPDWRAFLVCTHDLRLPALLWWSRSRVAAGWIYELAGTGDLPLDSLLPAGERLDAADVARGMRRVIVLDSAGNLVAALYLTRTGVLPSRDWIAEQLNLPPASRMELLAGRPALPQPDRGAILCVCHQVGQSEIAAAVHDGAATVDAIGQKTRAGTNCGSCRPSLAQLLRVMSPETREVAA